jgi:diguanylate cyclase (GGDEF)-like protein
MISVLVADRTGLVTPEISEALAASGCSLRWAGPAAELERLEFPDSAEVLLVGPGPDDSLERLQALRDMVDLAVDLPYVLLTPRPGEPAELVKGAFWTLTPPIDVRQLCAAVRAAAENGRLRRDLTRQTLALSTFDDVGRALTSTLKLKEVLNLIAEKITQLVPCEGWSLLLMDAKSDDLIFEIVTGPQPEAARGTRVKLGQGIAGWVAKVGEPLLLQHAEDDARFLPGVDGAIGARTRSVLCVPLASKEKILGVIQLINKKEAVGFGRHDLALVTALAGYGAIAIENARLYQQAEELAITDDTTQIPNMRYFQHILSREVTRARRRKSTLSLLFIDLDRFKRINDTYGHINGSRLLREVAHLIRDNFRAMDLVARYGGDEFVALLPDTDHATAFRLAERLRRQVESFAFHDDGGHIIKITCSVGIASFPDQAKTKEDLVRFADQAMYRAKGTRRNMVYSALQDHVGQLVPP